ncbi:unnamed protein product [Urochloa decumbens]|uniref:DUF6598 domain-containing protein n=1 Tax=Urochloa decumbens TaxID=240449 RepID=A0ABC8WJH6_9POAL
MGSSSAPMAEQHDDDEEEMPDLEPFFFDEAEAVADHERRLRREQEAARKEERRVWAVNVNKAVMESILDYDPKQEGEYCTRFPFADFSRFDLDEESPLGPMRYTDDRVLSKGDRYLRHAGVNILSVKIASLDVCFPVQVYGTVIVRDNIDRKCIYLFRREKDHCQLINSTDESLILTGPKRGLLLLDDAYIEIDLKIKDHQGQEEKELSKGFLTIRGTTGRHMGKCVVESKGLATRFSTMQVMYAVVDNAVEATIAIEVLRGEFYGKITACTTSIPNHLVLLHDSKVDGVMNGNGKGVIQLLLSVVSVCQDENLLVNIVAQTGDVECQETIAFTPRIRGRAGEEITVGATKLLVKVAWSLINNSRVVL